MVFVGAVTQQDIKTGVTLRARVTSPKGHYTAYQDFRCMVKQKGLTDEQAVAIDLTTVSNKLIANGITGITENITSYMPANGDNGTNIEYIVSGDDISNYINNDGIIIKRPAYGSNAAIGTLTIIVTKNAAIGKKDVTISVEPYAIEEITQFALESITWDTIKGSNGIETSDPATNGMYNVIYPLKLIPEIDTEMITTPIKVTWTVEQDILHSNGVITEERINVNSGIITRPSYYDIYEAKINGKIPSSSLEIITSKIENYSKDLTYMRINGLTLRADINIDGHIVEDSSVTFKLKTLTKALTNKEISDYLNNTMIATLSIKDTNYNTTFALADVDDATEKEVFYDTTGANSSILSLFGKTRVLSATETNDLTNSGIKITQVRWTVIDPSTVDSTPVKISETEYSSSEFGANGDEIVFILDPATAPTKTKLVLRSQVIIGEYDDNTITKDLFFRFTLTDVTPTVSGGGTGTTTP